MVEVDWMDKALEVAIGARIRAMTAGTMAPPDGLQGSPPYNADSLEWYVGAA